MPTFRTSKAKENILRKIRLALEEDEIPLPFPEAEKVTNSPVFKGLTYESLEENFAHEFTKNGGKFIFCANRKEFIENLNTLTESRGWTEMVCAHKDLFYYLVDKKIPYIREFIFNNIQAEVCLTDCEAAVARTGSLVFSSMQNHGRVSTVYFPIHIIVIQAHQIVNDIEDALTFVKTKYKGNMPSMINFTSGPSRTADIEKTLVTGIHGPKEIFCFFINS